MLCGVGKVFFKLCLEHEKPVSGSVTKESTYVKKQSVRIKLHVHKHWYFISEQTSLSSKSWIK